MLHIQPRVLSCASKRRRFLTKSSGPAELSRDSGNKCLLTSSQGRQCVIFRRMCGSSEKGAPVEAIELGKSMVPRRLFFTKGVGRHKERLTSFELALRDAGIAAQNLVRVSSIFPPQAKMITRKEGLKYLSPGEVVFSVVAENSTQGTASPRGFQHRGRDPHRPQYLRVP